MSLTTERPETAVINLGIGAMPDAKQLRLPAGLPKVDAYTRCPIQVSGRIQVYGFTLHMHEYGTSGIVQAIRTGSGSTDEIARLPHFDFNFQKFEMFTDEPKYLDDGDVVETRCTFETALSRLKRVEGMEWESRAVPLADLADLNAFTANISDDANRSACACTTAPCDCVRSGRAAGAFHFAGGQVGDGWLAQAWAVHVDDTGACADKPAAGGNRTCAARAAAGECTADPAAHRECPQTCGACGPAAWVHLDYPVVIGGERTEDEMCTGTLLVGPEENLRIIHCASYEVTIEPAPFGTLLGRWK